MTSPDVRAADDSADPDEVVAPTFGQLMRRFGASGAADELAISYGDDTATWRELDARSAVCARRLRALHVEREDLVAIALPNGVEHHVSTLGAWRAGATPCVLPTKLPGREAAQILEIAAPRVLVRHGQSSSGIVQIDPDDVAAGFDDTPLPDDLAASNWKAVASGGSTGRPKLIVDHGEARMGERLAGVVDVVGMPRGGVMLNPGPLYHNAPLLFTALALLSGTRVVGMKRFDPEEALRLIERERVEWVCLVPTMMHRIWSLPAETRHRYDVSSLKRMVHMAAACPQWLKRAWIEWLGPDRILEIYAGTESPGTIITGEEWLRKAGSVGRVTAGSLSVRDDDGNECAPNEVGEIFFPSAVAARFHYVGAEAKRDAEGRLSLGDLGYVDGDGYLFLSDRRTDLIIRGGANIYPAEIEAALIEHPAIRDAVVIGLPSEEFGARAHALVELAEEVSFEQLTAFLRERLATYKCPESYEIVKRPLRDEAGKVRRAALRDERLVQAHS